MAKWRRYSSVDVEPLYLRFMIIVQPTGTPERPSGAGLGGPQGAQVAKGLAQEPSEARALGERRTTYIR